MQNKITIKLLILIPSLLSLLFTIAGVDTAIYIWQKISKVGARYKIKDSVYQCSFILSYAFAMEKLH